MKSFEEIDTKLFRRIAIHRRSRSMAAWPRHSRQHPVAARRRLVRNDRFGYFCVHADDGKTYVLRHTETTDEWILEKSPER